jgi:hypothetical protein
MLSQRDPSVHSQANRFHARWASGHYLHRPWFAANRCLDVILTSEALNISVMLPFSLLSATHWGFKNSIPLAQIQTVRQSRFLGWWHTVQITFLDQSGVKRCLDIGFTGPFPQIGTSQEKTRDAFLAALQEARQEVQ